MKSGDLRIAGSIDVLVAYKLGNLNLLRAVERFSSLTGLSQDQAETFVRGMSRQNVLPLTDTKKSSPKVGREVSTNWANTDSTNSKYRGTEMANFKFSGASALLAHMLEGNKVSHLEAMLMFGVQSPTAEFGRMRRNGHLIRRKAVPMAKILRRINEHCTVTPPAQVPIREITMAEYWISQ
jgi:hypothetical protein